MDNLTSKSGRVFQINTSGGGLPKIPCLAVEVTELGIMGDNQKHTRVHGGLERALCLYSVDRILALQAEGHRLYPGALGENITISGLNWDLVQPGAKIRIGDQVLIEVTKYTSPCDALTDFFKDGDFARISQSHHAGWARVYARVLQTGFIQIGDLILLID